jgi:hypothetical protein
MNVKNQKKGALNRKAWCDLIEKAKNQQRVVKLMEEDEGIRQ